MTTTAKIAKSETQQRIDFLSWITDGKAEELGLKLFDEISQLYELQLAKMEFSALGANPETLRKHLA